MSRTPPYIFILNAHSLNYNALNYNALEEFVCKMYGSCRKLVILCRFLNLREKFKSHDNENHYER